MDSLKDDQVEPKGNSLQEATFRLPLKVVDSSQFDTLPSLGNARDCSNAVTNASDDRSGTEERFITSLHVTLRSALFYRKLLQLTLTSKSGCRDSTDSLKNRVIAAENRSKRIIPDQKELATTTPQSKYQEELSEPKKDSRDGIHSDLCKEQFLVRQSHDHNLQTERAATEYDLDHSEIMQAENAIDNMTAHSDERDSGLLTMLQTMRRENEVPEEKFSTIKEVSPTFETAELKPLEHCFENATITWHESMEDLRNEVTTANANIASIHYSESSSCNEKKKNCKKSSHKEELKRAEHIYEDVADGEYDRCLSKDDEHIYEAGASDDDVCRDVSDLGQAGYRDTNFKATSENERQPITEHFLVSPSESSLTDGEKRAMTYCNKQDKHAKQEYSSEYTVLLPQQNQMVSEAQKRLIPVDTKGSFTPKPTTREDDIANEPEDLGYARLTVKERVLQKEKELKELMEREMELRERPKRLSDSAKSRRWHTMPVTDALQKVEKKDSSLQEATFRLPLKVVDSSQFDNLSSLGNAEDCSNRVSNASGDRSGEHNLFITSLDVKFGSTQSKGYPLQSTTTSFSDQDLQRQKIELHRSFQT